MSETGAALTRVSSLDLQGDPGIFKNAVGSVSGLNRHSDGECAAIDRAVPHFMAALTLANQSAAICHQDIPQLRIKTTAHGLHGNAQVRSGILYMAKLDPAADIKSNAIFPRDFWRNLPEPRSQSLVAWRFRGHTEFVAGCDPHAALGIKNHVCNEGRGLIEIGSKDVAHARIIALFGPLFTLRQRHIALRRVVDGDNTPAGAFQQSTQT